MSLAVTLGGAAMITDYVLWGVLLLLLSGSIFAVVLMAK